MSKHQDFEGMIAQRIELARSKTAVLVAGAAGETDVERRQVLEECRLAIALAVGHLRDLRAAEGVGWDAVQRDMNDVWRRMETAVRLVTGESPVTLVAALEVPWHVTRLTN